MKQRIRRSANGCMEDDGVFKSLMCQNALRSDILLDQPEYLLAGCASIAQEFCQWLWSQCRARQSEPKCLSQHLACACATHELACSASWTGSTLRKLEILFGDLSSFDGSAHGPHLI